jgi:hypothetical protein
MPEEVVCRLSLIRDFYVVLGTLELGLLNRKSLSIKQLLHI